MTRGVDLSVKLGPLTLANPVMVASGTFGYGDEYDRVIDVNRLGAIVTKSITLKPRKGNRPPRIYETPSGMLNSIGLQNVGLKAFLKEKMPFLRTLKTKVIVNIAGERMQEYVELAEALDEVKGIHALELNISCPNCDRGGIEFGVDPQLTHQVISAVRKETRLPLIAKLSPNVTDIVSIAQAAESAGADILSLINTLIALEVDPETRKPRISSVTGGLSGPAIKPIALRMIWQVYRKVTIPIIGIGGIMNAKDAIEFFICGARAVQLGTANFVNPKATLETIDGIKAYLVRHKMRRVEELVGTMRVERKAEAATAAG